MGQLLDQLGQCQGSFVVAALRRKTQFLLAYTKLIYEDSQFLLCIDMTPRPSRSGCCTRWRTAAQLRDSGCAGWHGHAVLAFGNKMMQTNSALPPG